MPPPLSEINVSLCNRNFRFHLFSDIFCCSCLLNINSRFCCVKLKSPLGEKLRWSCFYEFVSAITKPQLIKKRSSTLCILLKSPYFRYFFENPGLRSKEQIRKLLCAINYYLFSEFNVVHHSASILLRKNSYF